MTQTFFSEEDIRPAELMKALMSRPDIGDKRKQLTEKMDRFIRVNCPACGSSQCVEDFVKRQLVFARCLQCQTVYHNPRPTLEMLKEYYADNPLYDYWNDQIFRQTEEARREKIVKPRVDRLLQYMAQSNVRPDVFVEIGAGYGTFSLEVKSRNAFKRVIAVEPTEHLAQTCRERGLEVIEKPFEEIIDGEINADVIVSFEVIEHLFSPEQFVRFCRKAIRQNGLFMLSCPNMQGFDIAMLREKSGSVGGEHINLFNPSSIQTLLKRCGFVPIDVQTPGALDAELVRKSILAGELDAAERPFLRKVLIEEWEQLRLPFQKFLAENRLSSHMAAVAVADQGWKAPDI